MSVIQISCLGRLGRFGNQLFQYAFAKGYARKVGAELQIPSDWIGRKLFNIDDNPIMKPLRKYRFIDRVDGSVDIDIHGYFQYQDALNLYTRSDVRTWFTFRPEIINRYHRKVADIVAHIRETDYRKYPNIYCIVNRESYKIASEKFGIDYNNIYWVTDSNITSDQFGFLTDFFSMMHCKILLRSNSTFSWWASTLGAARTFSPLIDGLAGIQVVPFIEGNWPKMVDPRKIPNCQTIVTDLRLAE